MNDRKFWGKVNRGKRCWLYTGARNSSGYGWLTRRGTQMHAHRYLWILLNGEIPDGLQVLHKCDTPACIRPSHLYLGTITDNMRDRADRRRCKTQKLSKAAVKEIRILRSIGWTCQSIADRFNVSNGHVSAVARGINYGRE